MIGRFAARKTRPVARLTFADHKTVIDFKRGPPSGRVVALFAIVCGRHMGRGFTQARFNLVFVTTHARPLYLDVIDRRD